MKVFLTSAYRYINRPYLLTTWLKAASTSDTWFCIDDPERADLIIFVESHPSSDPYFRRVLHNQVYRKYKHKCVLYHDADLSITPLRTIAPSIESWQYNPKHKRTAHYLGKALDAIDSARVTFDVKRDYLYSFIGSRTHAVRTELLNMQHQANVFIKDTTGLKSWELSSTDKSGYEQNYLDVMNRSLFVLCPRGIGPCSYRLFECMQLGRVPVIIADSWVPVPNIHWDEFSVRVAQKDITHLSDILFAKKDAAVEMGRKARLCWEKHFSPEVSLEQIATSGMELIKFPYAYSDFLSEHLQFFKSFHHLQNYFRYRKNSFVRKYKGFLRLFSKQRSTSVPG